MNDTDSRTSLRVSVRMFAAVRERLGRDQMAMELPVGATIADLRKSLCEHFPGLVPIWNHAGFAIDDVYVSESSPIESDTEVCVIPPVSGG
ncbi:MAG TPA: MoaD/ThiS family protein [Planctomycetaceae bacterium]|nr:MoaD/ThiS family protein [Planctomycetaceae bacterium]